MTGQCQIENRNHNTNSMYICISSNTATHVHVCLFIVLQVVIDVAHTHYIADLIDHIAAPWEMTSWPPSGSRGCPR